MIKVYRLKGYFGQKGEKQVFSLDVRATNPENAKEKALAEIGSKHKCKRYLIKLEAVDEIPAEESKSLLVKQLSEAE